MGEENGGGGALTSERAWYAKSPFKAGVDMSKGRYALEREREKKAGAGCGEFWGKTF